MTRKEKEVAAAYEAGKLFACLMFLSEATGMRGKPGLYEIRAQLQDVIEAVEALEKFYAQEADR